MESNSESDISEILNKVACIHPADLPLFYMCLSGWLKIQKSRLQILTLQRKLQNKLVLYMKRRQKRLRLIEVFNGPKMMCLLEHIRSPYQFQKLFRIKLPTFFKIKDILYTSDSSTSGLIPELELLLFLFWLSGGLSYKKVEKLLNVSETILRSMFGKIFDRFLKHISKVIQFPKTNYEYIGKGFGELSGNHIFGLAVGCLDAFHVPVAFPSQRDDLQYLNDEGEFSIQVQAVCNHRGALMDIAVGFPGGMLKPHVLQCTPLYLNKSWPPPGFVLVSGRGYPCLQEPICIMPPYTSENTPQKKAFNKHHENVHCVLRSSVGQMLDRWRRIFSKPIMSPLSDVTNIIIACAMIHNIGLEVEDVWPKEADVNFSVNKEHLSLVEGQTSGEKAQKQMSGQIIPFLLPVKGNTDDDESDEEVPVLSDTSASSSC